MANEASVLPNHVRKHRREIAAATIEFVLVMPIVLFLILVLIQTALLMAGQLYVHYAAFAATRAAIVQITRDLPDNGEPANWIDPMAGSVKFDAIRHAAWLGVMPVSGRDDTDEIDASEFADALREHFESLGQTAPRWVDTLVADRLGYAAEFTEIELFGVRNVSDTVVYDPVNVGPYRLGAKDAVAVRLVHRFNLSVPYVRGIFADDYHETKFGRSAYTEVAALYVLNLEGVSADLPDEPSLPRRD